MIKELVGTFTIGVLPLFPPAWNLNVSGFHIENGIHSKAAQGSGDGSPDGQGKLPKSLLNTSNYIHEEYLGKPVLIVVVSLG